MLVGVGGVAAATRIHGRDELEACRVLDVPVNSGNRHESFLQWLPEGVERWPVEFGELVEEQHAVVGERRLKTLDSGFFLLFEHGTR